MTGPAHRHVGLAEAFVQLIDTLGPGYDAGDAAAHLARACADLLPADAVGVLLVDEPDHLHVAAHVPDTSALTDVFTLDRSGGPGHRAFVTNGHVALSDLHGVSPSRAFGAAARRSGYRAAHALPMRCRTGRVGALTLLYADPRRVERADLDVAQALATISTIGILNDRASRADLRLTEQLQTALVSRVVIEQAKGVVAAHNSGDLDAAFARIRATARSNNIRVHDVAAAIVDGRISARDLARLEEGDP